MVAIMCCRAKVWNTSNARQTRRQIGHSLGFSGRDAANTSLLLDASLPDELVKRTQPDVAIHRKPTVHNL